MQSLFDNFYFSLESNNLLQTAIDFITLKLNDFQVFLN